MVGDLLLASGKKLEFAYTYNMSDSREHDFIF